MRYAAYVVLLGLVFSQVIANAHADGGTTTRVSTRADDVVHAQGVVRAIDSESNRIIISCDAVPALMWSPMTVGFIAGEKAMLGAVAPGQRVDFNIRQQGDEYVIARIAASKGDGRSR